MQRRIAVLGLAGALAGVAELGAGWFTGIPLTEMRGLRYKTFAGGLYPGGSNVMPADHAARGAARAAAIQPRDASGAPDPAGRYVLLSIGMSNTTQEFCSASGAQPCDGFTFMGQAAADPEVDSTSLAIVNGAMGGRNATFWDSPNDPDYDRVRDTVLAPRGLSEAQVQVVWMKVANAQPSVALPHPQADAYTLLGQGGNILRALKVRYPNLQQVYVSSRTYGGYATTPLNPEPYAYETGFAMKWLVGAQIEQMRTGAIDPRAGDLNSGTVAPWVAWGPYLWARGTEPRADGLRWLRTDFVSDGTHPTPSGRQKVGTRLLAFFKTSPTARCWFLAGSSCQVGPAEGPSSPPRPGEGSWPGRTEGR